MRRPISLPDNIVIESDNVLSPTRWKITNRLPPVVCRNIPQYAEISILDESARHAESSLHIGYFLCII